MRTAIVYDYYPALPGGGERELIELIKHFAPDVEIFFGFVVDSPVSRKVIQELKDTYSPEKVHTGPLVRWPREIWFRIMNFQLAALLQRYDFSSFDLVISYTAFISHAIVPPAYGRHILYTNTPARFLWNLKNADSFLKKFTSPLLITDLMKMRAQLYDLTAAEKVPEIWTISQATAQRVHSFYNRTASILYPPAIPQSLLKQEYLDPAIVKQLGSYFIHVSRVDSYKNVDLLIDTYEQKLLHDISVIVGDGPHFPHIKKRLQKLFGRPKPIELHFQNPALNRKAKQYGPVICTGFSNDQEKLTLLASASAAFSLNDEDFGITKVEALAVGTPVIAFRAGAAPEIIQEDVTGIFFDLPTPKLLALAIDRHKHTVYDKAVIRQGAAAFTIEKFHTNLDKLINA